MKEIKLNIKYYQNINNYHSNHWFNAIEKYFKYYNNGKVILWAHNSHVCNSNYTDYKHLNIGYLLKKHQYKNQKNNINNHKLNVYTILLDTFNGYLTATKNRNELPMFY